MLSEFKGQPTSGNHLKALKKKKNKYIYTHTHTHTYIYKTTATDTKEALVVFNGCNKNSYCIRNEKNLTKENYHTPIAQITDTQ